MRARRAGPPGIILACLVAAALPNAVHAEGDDAVLPYRPTASNPAQLPVPGQLELELGGLRQRSGDARRDSVPFLFKLAFSAEWGILLGGEAGVSSREGTNRARGVGDSNFAVKRAWELNDSTAVGIEAGAKLATAGDALGSGKTDYLCNAIFSKDFGAVHLDANLNFTRLGAFDPGAGRTQTGVATSLAMPLADRWGAVVEWSGSRRDGADRSAQLLGGLTFSPSRRLTFDLGVIRAVRPAPHATSFFAGVVLPVARLW